MAFTPNSLNQVSSGKNTVAPVQWAYSTADALAVVLASGYFNDAQDGYDNTKGRFKVDDSILVVASDGTGFVKVTVVTTNVQVDLFSGGGSSGVVASGEATWTGAGASDSIAVPGVVPADVVVASIKSAPTEAAYLVSAAAAFNAVNVALSAANTSNDAVISYLVLR
jgi:hypothetical protein